QTGERRAKGQVEHVLKPPICRSFAHVLHQAVEELACMSPRRRRPASVRELGHAGDGPFFSQRAPVFVVRRLSLELVAVLACDPFHSRLDLRRPACQATEFRIDGEGCAAIPAEAENRRKSSESTEPGDLRLLRYWFRGPVRLNSYAACRPHGHHGKPNV